MGLYYTSFIDKLKEKHKNFDGTLEEFLDNAGDIYEEYEVGEFVAKKTITKMFEDLGEL